jgi:hypothetical protein
VRCDRYNAASAQVGRKSSLQQIRDVGAATDDPSMVVSVISSNGRSDRFCVAETSSSNVRFDGETRCGGMYSLMFWIESSMREFRSSDGSVVAERVDVERWAESFSAASKINDVSIVLRAGSEVKTGLGKTFSLITGSISGSISTSFLDANLGKKLHLRFFRFTGKSWTGIFARTNLGPSSSEGCVRNDSLENVDVGDSAGNGLSLSIRGSSNTLGIP